MGFEGGVIPVYETAYLALNEILKPSLPLFLPDENDMIQQRAPRDLSPAYRKELAAKFEAAWQKVKGHSDIDNAYTALQDDTAGANAWFKAIDALVQPADGTFTSYRLVPGGGGYSLHQGDGPFLALGEILRSKANPFVTDLIIERFEQLVHDNANTQLDLAQLDKVLLALAGWDGKNHLADLRRLGGELDARVQRQNGHSDQEVNVTLCARRLELGDPTALQDYVDWLVKTPRAEFKKDSFSIMWRNPQSPLIQQAAAKLFGDSAHPWRPTTAGYQSVIDLLTTPMLGLPSFRQSVEDALADKSVIGKVKAYANGNFSIQIGNDPQEENYYPPEELPGPILFTSFEVRLCDYYASRLSKVDGFPCCALEWNEGRRDAAVAGCREFLHHYGDDFQYRAGDPDFNGDAMNVVIIHLPVLDHPATPEDVAQGRAVFSLSGTTRLCPLPNLPLAGWRPSHKTDPQHGMTSYPDGTSKAVIFYTTQGRIWQAEEQLVDGKWERYFGFIGRYQCEKVPASEIRFNDGGFTQVTPDLGGDLQAPFEYDQSHFQFSYGTRHFTAPGRPIPISLTVTNYSGFDRSVPPEILLPPGSTHALPLGITLALQYSEKLPPRLQSFSDPPFVYGPWHDVPLRPGVKTASSTAATSLLPTDKVTVLEADLRDYFDLAREGAYRLTATFHAPDQPAAKTGEKIFLISGK